MASSGNRCARLLYGLRGVRYWYWYSARITDPHQATAGLIDDLRVPEYDGLLKVFQAGLIQGKLPRQGPIRDPSATLEHRQYLIEELLKGHICTFAIVLALVHLLSAQDTPSLSH